MIGNVVDHRGDLLSPEVDATFEPSAHDNSRRADGTFWFDYDEAAKAPGYFHVTALYGITVREALLHAERTWSFAVTAYLYDPGSRPLG